MADFYSFQLSLILHFYSRRIVDIKSEITLANIFNLAHTDYGVSLSVKVVNNLSHPLELKFGRSSVAYVVSKFSI